MSLPRIEFALFDFDGVIADTNPLYMELDRTTLEHFGYTPTDEELRRFIGRSSEVEGPALLASKGINITTEDYLGVWDSDKKIYGSPSLEPSPGLRELWEALEARGVKIAVVSTTRCVSLVRALNHFQMLSYVDVIVGREMVEHHKPHPEPYLRALELLALGEKDAASRALAVDDSRAGVASAKAAGVYTICYQGSSETQDVEGADEVIHDFGELTARLA